MRPDLKSMKEAAEAGKWPEIKPLEWRGSWGKHTAECVFGVYLIKPRYDGHVDWFRPDDRKFWASSEKQAKAAAQADYEADVRTTLLATQPTAILALIEYVEGLDATVALIREEASKDNAPLGRSDSLALDRIRSVLGLPSGAQMAIAALNGGAS